MRIQKCVEFVTQKFAITVAAKTTNLMVKKKTSKLLLKVISEKSKASRPI